MKQLYAIQKLLALCLIFSMALVIPAGCSKKQETAGTISDFESQAHIQPGTSGDESVTGDTSKAPVSGEFVVSEKKYDYKDGNIMLLYVENQTDQPYTVTIKGKYLDENGETLKEETQRFEGFSAGWSNHFIFYPRFAFDSFTYKLETEDYIADPLLGDENGSYAAYTEVTYNKKLIWKRAVLGGDENGHSIEGRSLTFDHMLVSSHPSLGFSGGIQILILDSDGEVYCTSFDYLDSMGLSAYTDSVGVGCNPPGSEQRSKTIYLKEQAVGEDETIPENVQGVFTAIIAMRFMMNDNIFLTLDGDECDQRVRRATGFPG